MIKVSSLREVHEQLFATCYDRVLGRSERQGLSLLRRQLIQHAYGDLLELGAGTGANLPFCSSEHVASLTLVEPALSMVGRLHLKLAQQTASLPPVQVVQGAAEELPFAAESFDTVLATLVFCSVANPAQAMSEIIRVLKPGGRLLLLEHVRAQQKRARLLQAFINPLWRGLALGCCCTRNPLDVLGGREFTVEYMRRTHFPAAPRFLQPVTVLVARQN